MALQYLHDEGGNTTAVLVPIEEWEALTQGEGIKTHLDKKSHQGKKATDFKGLLSPEVAEALQKHVQQSREEWD